MTTEGSVPHKASPRVSILMPAFNAEATLERAIASVQAQTVSAWELLIVDDTSSDGTQGLALTAAQDDTRIRVLTHATNQGAAAARNTALSAASGRFIAFLDADDAWEPAKLARQLDQMAHSGAGLCYTEFWRVNGARRHRVRVPPELTFDTLLRGNAIGALTAIYDTEVFGKVEMPRLRMRQDYALWLTLLQDGGVAVGLNEPLATYHVTKGSLSANRVAATRATWQMYRHHFGFGALRSGLLVASHLLRRLRRG